MFLEPDEENISEELPFFKELDNFSYHEFKNHWNSGYSRVIENQLDVVHVPFVHKSTIGRGNKTLVNGPLVQVNKDEITIKVFNSIDDGNLPKDEEMLKETEKEQKLIFKFPNLWQNYINKDIRVLIAFSPIDDENTMLYLRFYQRLIKAPIFRSLFNLSGSLANYIIMNQDKKIVEEQIPKMSELKMGEKLITGDRPIVVYRKMRNELINKK